MTSAQIRQSFLDFFREKQHTVVRSSSLLPDAPNLMFTNAGMNQFVPIFLGKAPCPYKPARVADTQKCIRAGGKHNDLEDVGFDTYHHTFFEMLGNWSFGDYFKDEAIRWAWELLVERWKFPPERLYATVYRPGPSDPANADDDARAVWMDIFTRAGLDPALHIVDGGKKDNFWMMGETGPCGPCSEIHMSLLPDVDEAAGRALVNHGDARCIEIWNLVFIQFNADGKGGFTSLPSRHVDTGMGFERVVSIVEGTRGFTDFRQARVSNYETDIFRPIFDLIEALSGHAYGSTLPTAGASAKLGDQEQRDIAFRVIADHLRTLSFGIADGIAPGNNGRGYVLRRILRRAVRYGDRLGFREPFLHKLVQVLASTMGGVFPELTEKQDLIESTLLGEETSFLRTLGRGVELFNRIADELPAGTLVFPGEKAFKLYDTYGFPLDLTQVMARERGLEVDTKAYDREIEIQQRQSKESHAKEIIAVEAGTIEGITQFVGFDTLETDAELLEFKGDVVVVDRTPFYAAMGGQVGDTGEIEIDCGIYQILDTQKSPEGHILHRLNRPVISPEDRTVALQVDKPRRSRIEAHHSGTHLLHWALRQVLGSHVAQKGSYVGPDRLRFDFSHGTAMKPGEIADVEKLVNERILANDPVRWQERPFAEIKGDPSILQFFGDKYGDTVRVVSIGEYSKELCGGTHVRAAGRVGFFKILGESAIAAGIRRIEAVAGQSVVDFVRGEIIRQEEAHSILKKRDIDLEALRAVDPHASPSDLWQDFARRQAHLEELECRVREIEKQEAKDREAELARRAHEETERLVALALDRGGVKFIAAEVNLPDPAYLQALAGSLKKRKWPGVAVFGAADAGAGKVHLLASVATEVCSRIKAGEIIKSIAPVVGGRGGGKPELAQGGGTEPGRLKEALAQAEALVAAEAGR
jgi:alanyl-tRNA synthetase